LPPPAPTMAAESPSPTLSLPFPSSSLLPFVSPQQVATASTDYGSRGSQGWQEGLWGPGPLFGPHMFIQTGSGSSEQGEEGVGGRRESSGREGEEEGEREEGEIGGEEERGKILHSHALGPSNTLYPECCLAGDLTMSSVLSGPQAWQNWQPGRQGPPPPPQQQQQQAQVGKGICRVQERVQQGGREEEILHPPPTAGARPLGEPEREIKERVHSRAGKDGAKESAEEGCGVGARDELGAMEKTVALCTEPTHPQPLPHPHPCFFCCVGASSSAWRGVGAWGAMGDDALGRSRRDAHDERSGQHLGSTAAARGEEGEGG
jgi:hypothetical protein